MATNFDNATPQANAAPINVSQIGGFDHQLQSLSSALNRPVNPMLPFPSPTTNRTRSLTELGESSASASSSSASSLITASPSIPAAGLLSRGIPSTGKTASTPTSIALASSTLMTAVAEASPARRPLFAKSEDIVAALAASQGNPIGNSHASPMHSASTASSILMRTPSQLLASAASNGTTGSATALPSPSSINNGPVSTGSGRPSFSHRALFAPIPISTSTTSTAAPSASMPSPLLSSANAGTSSQPSSASLQSGAASPSSSGNTSNFRAAFSNMPWTSKALSSLASQISSPMSQQKVPSPIITSGFSSITQALSASSPTVTTGTASATLSSLALPSPTISASSSSTSLMALLPPRTSNSASNITAAAIESRASSVESEENPSSSLSMSRASSLEQPSTFGAPASSPSLSSSSAPSISGSASLPPHPPRRAPSPAFPLSSTLASQGPVSISGSAAGLISIASAASQHLQASSHHHPPPPAHPLAKRAESPSAMVMHALPSPRIIGLGSTIGNASPRPNPPGLNIPLPSGGQHHSWNVVPSGSASSPSMTGSAALGGAVSSVLHGHTLPSPCASPASHTNNNSSRTPKNGTPHNQHLPLEHSSATVPSSTSRLGFTVVNGSSSSNSVTSMQSSRPVNGLSILSLATSASNDSLMSPMPLSLNAPTPSSGSLAAMAAAAAFASPSFSTSMLPSTMHNQSSAFTFSMPRGNDAGGSARQTSSLSDLSSAALALQNHGSSLNGSSTSSLAASILASVSQAGSGSSSSSSSSSTSSSHYSAAQQAAAAAAQAAHQQALVQQQHQAAAAVQMDKSGYKRCNCKQSRCLKLYCECLARGEMCTDCNCVDCHNNEEHYAIREEAISLIVSRNPLAFQPKVVETAVAGSSMVQVAAAQLVNHAAVDDDDLGGARHIKGCHCKKSACLKKYCECFQAGVQCGEHCACIECKNCDPSSSVYGRKEAKRQPKPRSNPVSSSRNTTPPVPINMHSSFYSHPSNTSSSSMPSAMTMPSISATSIPTSPSSTSLSSPSRLRPSLSMLSSAAAAAAAAVMGSPNSHQLANGSSSNSNNIGSNEDSERDSKRRKLVLDAGGNAGSVAPHLQQQLPPTLAQSLPLLSPSKRVSTFAQEMIQYAAASLAVQNQPQQSAQPQAAVVNGIPRLP